VDPLLGPKILWPWTMYGCFDDFHVHLSKNCKGYMKNHEHRKLQWTFAYKNPLSIPWATKMPARKHDFCGTIPLEISIVNTSEYEQNISIKTAQKCLETKYFLFSGQLRSKNPQNSARNP
jgi:hypothetical protein